MTTIKIPLDLQPNDRLLGKLIKRRKIGVVGFVSMGDFTNVPVTKHLEEVGGLQLGTGVRAVADNTHIKTGFSKIAGSLTDR